MRHVIRPVLVQPTPPGRTAVNMKLKLEFPPSPEFAERHAANIVLATRDVDGTVLDYSLDSLHHVDRILQQMHHDGLPVDRIPSTLFRFGCYIGEVAMREHPAAWVKPARFLPESSLSFFPFIVLRFPNQAIWGPINLAFQKVELSEEKSVHASCVAQLASVLKPA
jgi:hypothetical protein